MHRLNQDGSAPSRRNFLKTAVAGGMGTWLAPSLLGQARPAPTRKMCGIQIAVSSFAPLDYEKVFDILQEKACVNTLFVKTLNYPGKKGQSRYTAGNYTKMHAQYYKDTILQPKFVQDPKVDQFDTFARIVTTAKKRGMQTYCWVSETHSTVNKGRNPTDDVFWERDLTGEVAGDHPAGPCSNNPNYRNFVWGLFEDYARSYDIDGIMWGVERQGPMTNSLGAFHDGDGVNPDKITCFCEFCMKKGKDRGIDCERAKEGFRELAKYVKAGRAGQRPTDGYYVTFWRTILDYPEIIAWQKLWTDSTHEIHQGIYAKVKSVKPNVLCGWHIWHNISFNPLFRAEEDYRKMAKYSDYIKPVLYYNSAGARMAAFVRSVNQNMMGDLTKDELTEFEYKVMNYNEGPYNKIAETGFTPDYLYKETKRGKDDLAGTKTQMWSGIDIDVSSPGLKSKSTPESVREAVKAVFRAGGEGVLLSRLYTEMKVENLKGAGDAMRELGYA